MDATVRTIGRYRIIGRLSAGGGGVVYRVLDDAGLPAALKIARSGAPRETAALAREIRVVQRLNRAGIAGIVRLYEAGQDGERPWYAMEWVAGSDLRSLVHELWGDHRTGATEDPTGLISETIELAGARRDSAPPRMPAEVDPVDAAAAADAQSLRRALAVLARVATVLRDIHARGLVHGDVSPGNILLRDSGEPVLLDFGTSFAVYEAESSREFPYAWEPARGTPGYAAPEVLSGRFRDLRCDIYGLGCIAYELLTGRRPFVATNVQDLVAQHLGRPVPHPRLVRPELPEDLQQLLLRMLEKEPGRRTARTHSIVRAFCAALQEAAPSAPDRVHDAVLFRPPLCGREAELSELEAALDDARSGRGRLIVVSGPAGIGKTRLLNEAASLAAGRGMIVITARVTGRGPETDEAPPMASAMGLVSAVLQCANELHALGFDLEAAAPGEMPWARIRTVLQPYGTSAATDDRAREEPTRLDPDAAIQRVFGALSALLLRLARPEGLLLLLDDLHWTDALSCRYLEAAAPTLEQSRIMVLGAHRSDADGGPFQSSPNRAHTSIALRELQGASIVALAKGMLGLEALPEGLDDFVIRCAEGNPLFAAEYLRLAAQQSWLRLGDVVEWQYPGSSSTPWALHPVPTSVDELVSSRLSRLPASARELVRVAAVIGRDFDEATLAHATSRTGDFAEPLRALIRAQIIEELPDGAYRFTYDKLREAAARATSAEAQRNVHLALARGIEAGELRSLPAARSARLGHHWSRAGVPANASVHLRAAAQQASSKNALDLACDLYRAAIAQCSHGAFDGAGAEALSLQEELGDVLLTRARHVEARDCYDRAALGNPDPLARARLHRKRAASLWTAHDYEAASLALDLAEAELAAVRDADAAARARETIEIKLGRFEQLYFSQKHGPQIESLIDDLAPLVEAWGDDSQRNTYYLAAASQRQLAARYAFDAQAVALARKALEATHSLTQERQAVARFLFAFSLVFGNNADREAALPHLEQSAKEAAETQSVTLLSRIRAHHAIALRRLGRLPQTSAAARLSLEAAEAARLPPYVAASTACLGWVSWRSGELEQARRQLERARQLWLSHPHPFPLRWLASLPLLAFAEADDDFEAASELLKDLIHNSQQVLPAALDRSVRAALEACAGGLAREASEAIRDVLLRAHEEHFC